MATQIENQAAIEAAITRGETIFLKYKKQIICCVVVVVAVICAILAYVNLYANPRAEESSTALAQGQEYFATQQYELALNGDKKNYKGFIAIADQYSDTKAGNLANLYAGLCSAQLNKWEDAVKYLESYSTKSDAMVSPSALFALGNAYANTKQLDKAVSTMKDAAAKADAQSKNGTNNSISPLFLLRAAEILASQNKNEEALALYQDIKKKYVNSSATGDIDKYIESVSQK